MHSIRFLHEHAHILQLLLTKEGIAKIVMVGVPMALDAILATLTAKANLQVDRFNLRRKSEGVYQVKRLRIPNKQYHVVSLYSDDMLATIASKGHLPHLFERSLKDIGIPFIPEAAHLYIMALEKFLEPVDSFGVEEKSFDNLVLPAEHETIYRELFPFTKEIESIASKLALSVESAERVPDGVLQ